MARGDGSRRKTARSHASDDAEPPTTWECTRASIARANGLDPHSGSELESYRSNGGLTVELNHRGSPVTDYATIARELTEGLGLKIPPVYVRISDRIPEGIPLENRAAAAGCVFWERAATQSFATSPALHADCCIGVHTHNLSAAVPTQAEELGAALAAMKGLHYVADDEVMAIPVINRPVDYVIYGPLAECTAEPDAVLIFAHSKQGLIITEAVQRIDRQTPPAMGRPACAVIPQVVNHKTTAVSLGCCGARAYLDTFTDDVSLWALPGAKLKEYADQITIFSRANKTLTSFHSDRRIQVARGEHPTVKETLAHLST